MQIPGRYVVECGVKPVSEVFRILREAGFNVSHHKGTNNIAVNNVSEDSLETLKALVAPDEVTPDVWHFSQ
jgi:hypothetical protein